MNTSVLVREPTYRDLTLAIEFLTSSLRAMSDGHAADSDMVVEPLTWAKSKLREMVVLPMEGQNDGAKAT